MCQPQLRCVADVGAACVARAPGSGAGQARRSISHPRSQILHAFINTADRFDWPDFIPRVGSFGSAAAIATALVFLNVPSYDFRSEPLSTRALLTIATGLATGWEAILVALELYRLQVARPNLSNDMPVGNDAPTTTGRGGEEGGYGQARRSIPHQLSQILQAFFGTTDRLQLLDSTLRVGGFVSTAAIATASVTLIIHPLTFSSESPHPVALGGISSGGAAGLAAIAVALEYYRLKVARPYLNNDMPVVNDAPTITGRVGEEGDYGQAGRSIPHQLSQILQAFFDTTDQLQRLDSTLRVGGFVPAAAIATALGTLVIPPLTFSSESPHPVALGGISSGNVAGLTAIAVALKYYRLKVARPYLSNDMPVGNNAPTTTGRGGEEVSYSAKLTEEFAKLSRPKKFSYEELMITTDSFSDDRILGRGGFGIVQEGHVADARARVAVKIVNHDSRQGIKDYISEVKSLSQLRHRNLVQLIGYCHEANKFVLVYEFIGGGTLEDHLFEGRPLLTWERRYNIALGLASALHYLHKQCHQCVIHRDIKSSNVMLDEKFVAKLGDFGSARLVDHTRGPNTTESIGMPGYLAPECYQMGNASKESDIYSFGVVLLEIVCGRRVSDSELAQRSLGLVQWVWKRCVRRSWSRHWGWRRNLLPVDRRLGRDFNKKQAEALMIVGLWCAYPIAGSRPSIEEALAVLNLKAEPPELLSKMSRCVWL